MRPVTVLRGKVAAEVEGKKTSRARRAIASGTMAENTTRLSVDVQSDSERKKVSGDSKETSLAVGARSRIGRE